MQVRTTFVSRRAQSFISQYIRINHFHSSSHECLVELESLLKFSSRKILILEGMNSSESKSLRTERLCFYLRASPHWPRPHVTPFCFVVVRYLLSSYYDPVNLHSSPAPAHEPSSSLSIPLPGTRLTLRSSHTILRLVFKERSRFQSRVRNELQLMNRVAPFQYLYRRHV